MGVELSSVVIGFEVEHRLVKERDDLDVGLGAEELDTSDRTLGDETGSAAGLGAPRDFLTLGLADGSRARGRSPDTPV